MTATVIPLQPYREIRNLEKAVRQSNNVVMIGENMLARFSGAPRPQQISCKDESSDG